MPDQLKKPVETKLQQHLSFHQRHDEIRKRRAELIARLSILKKQSTKHPGYKRALRLLNNTFSGASLAQRSAVLKAAAWLINLIEHQIAIEPPAPMPAQQPDSDL